MVPNIAYGIPGAPLQPSLHEAFAVEGARTWALKVRTRVWALFFIFSLRNPQNSAGNFVGLLVEAPYRWVVLLP